MTETREERIARIREMNAKRREEFLKNRKVKIEELGAERAKRMKELKMEPKEELKLIEKVEAPKKRGRKKKEETSLDK